MVIGHIGRESSYVFRLESAFEIEKPPRRRLQKDRQALANSADDVLLVIQSHYFRINL